MKNRALLLTLLLPLTLTACNSALLKRAKKIIKNANYDFQIKTSSQNNNRSLKRNKVQPKESIYHSDTGMLEIDFDQKMDLKHADFFENINGVLSDTSKTAKAYAYQLVETVKNLQKLKEKDDSIVIPSGIYFNDETGEVETFTKAINGAFTIHIYKDGDNDEIVEYGYYNSESINTQHQKVIYCPDKISEFRSVSFDEEGKMSLSVIKMQKIDNAWIGVDYWYEDGTAPRIVDGYADYSLPGIRFLFQIDGFDYGMNIGFECEKEKEPTYNNFHTNFYGVDSKCGILNYPRKEINPDEFNSNSFTFCFEAYKGISKLFLNTRNAEHHYNPGNDGYDFQRFNDDSSYLLTDTGKEIRSAFIFDTQTNQMVEEENENTIKCNQTGIFAWRGKLYEGTFEDYTISQIYSYVHFGDIEYLEAKRRIQSLIDYYDISIADGLDTNNLENLFNVYTHYNDYSQNIFTTMFNKEFSVENVYDIYKQSNKEVKQQIKELQEVK